MEQQRIFIKVVGFSDVERHALNTVFRLSEGRELAYALWAPDAPEAPRLSLVDGQSYEGRLELEASGAEAEDETHRLLWVGSVAPARAWRSFERPLSWPAVVRAIDELFQPAPGPDLDFDLDLLGAPEPAPAEMQVPAVSDKRALLIEPQAEDRLYLRTKLAGVGLVRVDEAATGAQAQELLRQNQYDLVVLDVLLPDLDGWQLLKQIPTLQKAPPPRLIVTGAQDTAWLRARAWFSDAQACLGRPLHPGRLQWMLQSL